jgi:hypothetical protein
LQKQFTAKDAKAAKEKQKVEPQREVAEGEKSRERQRKSPLIYADQR